MAVPASPGAAVQPPVAAGGGWPSAARRERLRRWAPRLVLLALVLMLVLVATLGLWRPGSVDPAQELQAARAALDASDVPRARVHLRNVLNNDREHAEARLLMGRAALMIGGYADAEQHLGIAHGHGHDPQTVVPLLAQALSEGGQPAAALAVLKPDTLADARTRAVVLAYRARAWLREGKPAEADADIAAARALAADGPELGVTEVFRLGRDGDLPGAARRLAEVLDRHPQHLEALALRAMQAHDSGATADAVTRMQALVQRAPAMPALRSLLGAWLLEQGRLADVAEQVKALRALPYSMLEATLLQARLQLRQGQADAARSSAAQALKAAPDHPPALRVAIDAEFALGDLALAESLLRRLLRVLPDDVAGRRQLAELLLRQGQPQSASELLAPVVATPGVDVASLVLAGRSAARAGDLPRAMKLYQRAAQQQPQALDLALGAAVSKLLAGDRAGLADLADLARRLPANADVGLLLLMAQLDARQHDAALRTLQALQAQSPPSAWLLNLRGAVLGSAGDLAGARAAFTQALALDATHGPALQNLVRLDLQDGNAPAAEARLRQALAARPDDVTLLGTLAQLLQQRGAPHAEVTALRQRAHAAQPSQLPPRVALVQALLAAQEVDKALALARQTASDFAQSPEAVTLLADTLLAAGQPEQALWQLQQFVRYRRPSPQALWALARLQLAAGTPAAAREAAAKARAIDPDRAAAALAEAEITHGAGAPREALALLAEQLRTAGDSAAALALQGDIHWRLKDTAAAAHSYRRALDLAPGDARVAVALHRALLAAGQARAADQLARRWQHDQPQDRLFPRHLADRQLAAADWAGARRAYEALLPGAPPDAVLLNNLAWACLQLADPCAQVHSDAALARAPGQAAVLDTAGQVQLQRGNTARALDLFTRAQQAAPNDPQITHHRARALVQAGQRDEARQQLLALLGRGVPFDGRPQAQQLLDGLR